MTDPLDELGARWRAGQPPPPEVDLDRLTGRPARRRPLRLAAVVLVAAGAVTAVAAHHGPGRGGAGGGDVVVPAGGLRLVGHVQPAADGSVTARQIAQGQLRFGLDLLAARCAGDPTRNDVLSPTSAALALGMLRAGAVGDTRTAIDRLLHLPAGTGAAAAQQRQTAALRSLAQVQVSDHVFAQRGVRPTTAALDELATSYAADLRAVDFAGDPGAATDAINRAVKADTRGLIPALFDQPLDAGTTTVLTDAVHLAAPWQKEFGAARTAPFHTAAGRQVDVRLMDGSEQPGAVRRTGGWTSVTLPYAGGRLQAVVVLPEADAPAGGCRAPSAGDLDALASAEPTTEGVDLPELHLTQTSGLTDTLAALGLPLHGDYSGLGAPGAEVSDVVQRTVLDVDEHGTTAAAATGVAILASLRSPLVADRPFFLLIEDTATGSPLFLAHVTDPTASAG